MGALSKPSIDWGSAALTLPGQTESGDRCIVKPFPDGALVAAVDGIGHGDEAAAAALAAIATLEAAPHQEPVITLLTQCHENLRSTRGVVMSLAWFDVLHGMMTWLGVGNVMGILLRPQFALSFTEETLLLRGGVVGSQLPVLQAAVLQVNPGDTLILATDGLRTNFATGPIRYEPPQKAADRILAEHAKGNDDALVLVARYLGGPA
jgi:hypothetical protein